MLRIGADDPHHALAVDHLAFVAHFLDGCPNFHFAHLRRQESPRYSFFTILPRPGSCGDNSTWTRSPGRTRTKFVFAAPAACARTTASLPSFTFTIALGSNSTTTASTLLTAASKPTARSTSLPRNAQNAPTTSDLWSPPSICRAKPACRVRRHSPSVR